MPSIVEFESVLRRHVLDPWFPRCVDREHGGFLCDFERDWSSDGPHERLMEFQARHLCVAADALERYPDDVRFRPAMEHGFRYLKDVMWDQEYGGWFHRVARDGRPLEAETKHIHGFAYGLDACAAIYEVTRDPAALALAEAGFRWMDAHAHDREHGGWFGFLTRQGEAIRSRPSFSWPFETDSIGTPFGLKDLNVHSDLLETFQRLYRVWPDPVLHERLAELVEIMSEKMLVPSHGALHYYCLPDWRPLPHLVRSGYQFQAAYRLTMAPDLVGQPDAMRSRALLLVDNALRHAKDPQGGYWYAAPGVAPDFLEGHWVRVAAKPWWVQFEAIKALLAVSKLVDNPRLYLDELNRAWDYIKENLVDDRNAGIYCHGLDEVQGSRRRLGPRFAPAAVTRKGDVWKDARHEARALLYCMEHYRDN